LQDRRIAGLQKCSFHSSFLQFCNSEILRFTKL